MCAWQHSKQTVTMGVIRPILKQGQVGNEPATFKFFESGDANRVDIYYGGDGSDPLSNDNHGHIVIKGDNIISWLEPGVTKHTRNRLY